MVEARLLLRTISSAPHFVWWYREAAWGRVPRALMCRNRGTAAAWAAATTLAVPWRWTREKVCVRVS